MSSRLRRTPAMLAVLDGLLHLDRPYGLELVQTTGLASGTVYPILARLEAEGLVSSRWESEEPMDRPRRRFYEVTPDGLLFARSALSEGRPVARKPAATPGALGSPHPNAEPGR
ncbi:MULTISPECIES: helix-turn-helix transcriptional regulator [unclassified Streptomyces]|uniref:PadR family transcriptional regulator n=1 Tax=unclassified Streptomyces TaxID=2593676 RepID=UPI002E2BC718|nr:helix-turn-helix transcriptional regulator [Streptomyces sp. NBC_01423]WSX89049.1 PadR family transcriptional regulator [Streptomyces sp. NBC_00891]WSY03528.1 PadR family transcriptional regulator [Streptomyces sp. NBC_00890]WSZ05155.1 PadR family transcriptional regulator [Streptomyces sp. NBC_00869]WSZ27350.1 PadR family transcriptional regulator [Streptomyces sp. NBC_00870]